MRRADTRFQPSHGGRLIEGWGQGGMIESELPRAEGRCREAVQLLLARHGWRLLEPEELARRAFEHLREGIAADPRRAAIYAYSQALYVACSGAEGGQRQNLAYTELFRYLYDGARRRYPDVCEDATQQALESTFASFARCRQPGTFLAFAFQRLMDAARTVRRQEDRRSGWIGGPLGDEHGSLVELLPDPEQMDPAEQVLAGERRLRFEQCSGEFLAKHPRAHQQLAALRLKYIEGLDDAEISRRLGKPISSVYVLRARAVEKLRVEPSWRSLAAEFGIVTEDRSAVVRGDSDEDTPIVSGRSRRPDGAPPVTSEKGRER